MSQRSVNARFRQIMARKIAGGKARQQRVMRIARGPVLRYPARLRSASREEVKSVDIAASNFSLNATPLITAINLVESGTGFNNRVGRKICMKSLYITGNIVYVNLATKSTIGDYCRIIVVYDRQTNGALPAIADYILSVTQAAGTSSTVYDQFNVNNRDRFLTLMDERLAMPLYINASGPVGPSDGTTKTFNIQRYLNLKNLVTQFKSDSSPSVIGDIATGSLFMITMGAIASGSENFQFNCSMRLRYTDA